MSATTARSKLPIPPTPAASGERGAVLRLVCRGTGETLEVHDALEVGIGGEARVYALPDDPSRVAKVYRAPTPEHARKVERMRARPPLPPGTAARGVRLAWPLDVLHDAEGRFAGYVMARAEGTRLFELYNPATRRARAPHADHAVLHRAGWNLAAAFEALHAAGYVVGDVNESNVLVADDGSVTLVDADSLQVPAAEGGVHRCPVGKPEYTPPELQDAAFGQVDRTPAHDRFGLGVLLFQLLMEGTHPFAARLPGREDAPPLGERIRQGWFPYRGLADLTAVPPRLALPPETLHPDLQRLFHRCFVEGHADPAARPSPAEWREALARARAALVACAANPRHRHGGHLLDCPWCDRARLLGGRDPFPAPAPEPPEQAPAAPPPGSAAAAGAVPAAAAAAHPNFAPLSTAGPIPPAILTLARGVHAVGLDRPWVGASLGASVTYFAFGPGGRILAALFALGAALLAWEDLRSVPPQRRIATYTAIALAALLLLMSFDPFLGARASVVAEDYPEVVVVPARTPAATLVQDFAVGRRGGVTVASSAQGPAGWVPVPAGAIDREMAAQVPEYLLRPAAHGTVRLTLTVDTDGRVLPGSLRVREASDAQLAGAAAVAYLSAAFSPPPRPTAVHVTLTWNLPPLARAGGPG